MSEPLRILLLALVLLNLAFVQLTGAVSGAWMALLWTLCAASPLLAGLHERRSYVAAWNLLLLGAFLFLLRHALTTGLLHMLEDGLLLAALCQVHLLNTIGRRQRPDLLFFNSFLITFVTSFFSPDLGWSIGFCLYAALLVPALQLFVVLPRDGSTPAGTVPALLRDSVRRSLAALAVTAAVFVLWPRDFRHAGWLGDTLNFSTPQLVAFAEEIRLDRRTTPALDDAPVLRIRPRSGLPGFVPEHWRGVTFVRFEGASWRPYRARDFRTRAATDLPWHARSRGEWQRAATPSPQQLDLRLVELDAGRLFLPLLACHVRFEDEDDPVLVDPKADGVLAFTDFSARRRELRAVVQLGTPAAAELPRLSGRARALLCQVPEALGPTFADLAERVSGTLPAGADEAAVAEHHRQWLQRNRRYALPGTTGAARNLGEFLLGAGGGHCEYFATTLAMLLRQRGIPCRVAGGYLAHEWDDRRGEVVVRHRDAHAWVEALLPELGWTTLDATPATALRRTAAAPTWWQEQWRSLEALWHRVTGFDEDGRRRLVAWLAGLPAQVADALRARPLLSTCLLLVLLAWLWQRRRRRCNVAVPVRRLQRAIRRSGLCPLPGETPRELLARAGRELPSPAAAGRLRNAVREHERSRYGH